MRLLLAEDKDGFSLVDVGSQEPPKYAVLSHTWLSDGQEVTFDDIKNGTGTEKEGRAKLRFCSQQAKQDGIQYVWVDTCCINKSDSTELAEAITSMFRWYSCAEKCYAYLGDVTTQGQWHDDTASGWKSQFRASRWHRRGWTLQELLAPRIVEFWSRDHVYLGDRSSMEQEIHEITSIPYAAIRGDKLTNFEPTNIKAWALGRETKREEDQAYCLMGLFDVSMLPNYGEGKIKAMQRLNRKISKVILQRLQQHEVELSAQRHDSVAPSKLFVQPQEFSDKELADFRLKRLKSLRPATLNERRNIIRSARHNTCDWLMALQEYQDWKAFAGTRQQHSFLWLNGKAGAGKSTIMKFALEHAEAHRQADEIIVFFFFNARGEESEKTTLGMWKALLYQILSAIPDLHSWLDTICSYPQHGNDSPQWTVSNLAALFTVIIPELRNWRLKCFIDALDECDEYQIREMLAVFQDAGMGAEASGVYLRVCFASRPYPNVSIRHATRLTLQTQQGHSDAIARYVESHLYEGYSPSTANIRARILQKANGIFMWAVLVTPMLNMEFDRGRIFAVERRLEEIPQQLSEVFKQILRRDQIHMDEMLLCFQWILFAMRPLKVEEFYFAMMSGLGPTACVPVKWNPADIPLDSMRRYVLSSSKGLAEVRRVATIERVQFIHESVRDFLLKDRGLHELWPELGEDLVGTGHDRLRECCNNYLNTDNMPSHPWTLPVQSNRHDPLRAQMTLDPLNSLNPSGLNRSIEEKLCYPKPLLQFPLLGYASNHILNHTARSVLSIPENLFLQNFRLKFWYGVVNRIDEHGSPRHPQSRLYYECPNLLYILAEYNCSDLIRTLCRDGPLVGQKGGRYHYPLLAALANRHSQAAQALLDPQKSSTHLWPVWQSQEYKSAEKHEHPMLWALQNGQDQVASMLLNARDLHFNALEFDERDMLSWAAQMGIEDVISWIARVGPMADLINKPDGDGTPPLARAAENGKLSMISVLRSHGADVNATDSEGRTVMHYARHKETIQALLDNGADIEFQDNDGWTPLILAVADRDPYAGVEALLDKGANIEASDKQGLTPLLVAVQTKQKRLVQQLLANGVDVDHRDNSGRTALVKAASHGYTDIVELLLDAGADIEARDNRGMTALLKAARVRDGRCLQLLLDRGANSEARDVYGMTALLHVPHIGSRRNVQLLLDRGVDIESRDDSGMTALLHAANQGQLHCLQVLLENGANIEAQDNAGTTALLAVVARNHTDLARILLESGANIEAHDAEGTKALGHAAIRRNQAAVRLLLERGADPSGVNSYGMW